MAELNKLLPPPPHVGPPLSGVLKAYWPWVAKPPQKDYVLPIVEAPELVVEPEPEIEECLV